MITLRAAAVASNPNLVSYTFADRWNGQMPATVLGSQTAMLPMLDLGHSPRP